jgi:hypothetical protein
LLNFVCNPEELFGHVRVFLSEPVDTTGRIDKTLLASEKGMAMGTNFNVKFRADSGRGAELVSAGATDCGFKNFRMQIFLHGKPPVSKERGQLNHSQAIGKSKFVRPVLAKKRIRKGLWLD